MSSKLRFTIPSRIHLTLIAMGVPKYRVNGGIGFSIKGHDLLIEITTNDSCKITDHRPLGLDIESIAKLEELINLIGSEYNYDVNIFASIAEGPSCHTGFGTGTSTTLCLIEALHLINNSKVDNREIIISSGRGGTSGIGINTYFHGGFITEFGRPSNGDSLVPSSHQRNITTLPLVISRDNMPDWGIALCIPRNTIGIYGNREKDFFDKVCPIDDIDVNETLFHSLFGCTAAIKENDYHTFCESVTNIQNCTWKKSERTIYGKELVDIENIIHKHSDCSAMSSLGPGLVFFSQNIEKSITYIKTELESTCDIFRVTPDHSGRNYCAI